jgi:CheY-like chemotaxis protein
MVSLATNRVLCVDDTEDDCELFRLVLSEVGYDVELAQSFADALQLIETRQFDLYLFDLSIPGGTGFELLERVRAIHPSTPVIICTAEARDCVQQQAMQAGAQAFLTKPVCIDRLVETIAQLLLLHSTEPEIF